MRSRMLLHCIRSAGRKSAKKRKVSGTMSTTLPLQLATL